MSVMIGLSGLFRLRSYCSSTLMTRCSFVEMSKSYEDAIKALNSLQSNAATIEKIRTTKDQNRHQNIPDMISMTKRVGITVDDIDKLKVIHVSGTKGKGSTCAFVESILRSLGFRTGFYSSPHLVEVRERIRINGRPLSRDDFSRYFWHSYQLLNESKAEHRDAMPAYFRFLTIMAFHAFMQKKVDVAILEVGIGGQYDCTNIVRNPVVCGVTSLGIDHTSMLGDSIDKIAWHKAGIFKPNVPAVTVQQPEAAMEVLRERATEIGCPLFLAPSLDSYDWNDHNVELGIPGVQQQLNASLALQLCQFWIKDNQLGITENRQKLCEDWRGRSCGDNVSVVSANCFNISAAMAAGLHNCVWPARSQKLSGPGITYYLDGAHTAESLQLCADWFNVETLKEAASLSGNRIVRVLLFNMTGDRKPESLLSCLLACNFDFAVFCPNIHSRSRDNSDLTNLTVTIKSQIQRCEDNCKIWLQLYSEYSQKSDSFPNHVMSSNIFHKQTIGSLDSEKSNCSSIPSSNKEEPLTPALAFSTILDSLAFVSRGCDPRIKTESNTGFDGLPNCLQFADHIQVLCVGSLHLVGGILSILNPTVCDS